MKKKIGLFVSILVFSNLAGAVCRVQVVSNFTSNLDISGDLTHQGEIIKQLPLDYKIVPNETSTKEMCMPQFTGCNPGPHDVPTERTVKKENTDYDYRILVNQNLNVTGLTPTYKVLRNEGGISVYQSNAKENRIKLNSSFSILNRDGKTVGSKLGKDYSFDVKAVPAAIVNEKISSALLESHDTIMDYVSNLPGCDDLN